MAEVYSAEYTATRIVSPRQKISRSAVLVRKKPFNYTHVATGTTNDTLVLEVLPPQSALDVVASWIRFTGHTSTVTLSIGWKAYKDTKGVIQAASATGIYNAVPISNNTGVLGGGMLVVGTPDDALPAVYYKDFDNAEEVVIFATYGTAAPGNGAVIQGVLAYEGMG